MRKNDALSPDALRRSPHGEEWPAGSGKRGGAPVEYLGRDSQHRGGHRQPVRLTARGAGLTMLAAYTAGLFISAWTGAPIWAGIAFACGSVLAARYAHPQHLLTIAVAPPLLFGCALAAVTALTAPGGAVAAAAGALLTLGATAPWLFAGTAAALAVCWWRGLPRCVADLRRDLRPEFHRKPARMAADAAPEPRPDRPARG